MEKYNHSSVCAVHVRAHSRQPLQEELVERLLAAAAPRHTEQQRVSKQRGAVRGGGAKVPVVGPLPQVEGQLHPLLFLRLVALPLLASAQLVPAGSHIGQVMR